MKKILCNLIFLSLVIAGYSQNRLTPIWKYHHVDDLTEVTNLNDNDWQSVNLLLSWERQGYCDIDENCVIKNDFFISENDANLQLEFSFPAEVNAVYINQSRVVGKVPNSFRNNRDQKTIVSIPDSILKRNSKNEITILFDNLAYTGGVGHNFCSIHTADAQYENSLSIEFPTENHVYLTDDKQQFIIHSENISDNSLRIIINNDFHETLVDESVEVKKRKQEYAFDLKKKIFEPGLYECIVISEGQTYLGTVEWFAIRPEDISCSAQKPDGFDTYWQNAINDLHKIEPNYKIEKVDSLCSATRNGYVVEMTSLGNLTIRGYYFVPKTEGKHPAVLHVPGYHYGFENLAGFINREGNCAELALCVRGHGISKDVFNPWDTMTLWAVGICDRKTYIYRSVFMDCVRAVEFLANQPEIDNTRIGVAGGSQGGGLTLATAALCNSNIAACAFFDPWLCDLRDQTKIRTTVNKELALFKTYPGITCNEDQMLSVIDYFDTKHFATDIKCPVYFLTSLFDDDCPSHCGFAAYNNLSTQKEYMVFPKNSHLGESGEYDKLFYLVESMLTEN